jgi:uncharacterized Tic20 family protein
LNLSNFKAYFLLKITHFIGKCVLLRSKREELEWKDK